MSRNIPIIRLYHNLLVSIQIELSDDLVTELKDGVCAEIQRYNPKGLIIEVSGIDILDSYIARSLRDLSQVARLMGVKTIIVGLDPAMAITLVEMGLALSDIRTALNLEAAMETLAREDRENEEVSVDAGQLDNVLGLY